MSSKTKIEWTQRTWSPVVGCTKISDGCKHCYAEKMACRLASMACSTNVDNMTATQRAYTRVVKLWHNPKNEKTYWEGWNNKVECIDSCLEKPLHWKKPSEIFVCSMGDLFHPDVPFGFIEKVMATIEECPQHTFQILTKREKRLLEYAKYRNYKWPDNIIGMVSCENQPMADLRIPYLLQCGFKTTGVSLEPLLGPGDLKYFKGHDVFAIGTLTGRPVISNLDTGSMIDWCIVGCETNSPKARRENYNENAIAVVEQCISAGVPVFVKSAIDERGKVVKDIEKFPIELQRRQKPERGKE